ncbi:MAG: ABC transporter ATP-binding protein [Leptolyngbya sp. PLA3]|nr:MAG: ABC transporter ATP-binding protein [Cyanobacteria bacterium CYA]MCE7967269.1 ABC transporter ATP-binding protein [Leptolyngbya sp. PL-A3]
MIRAERVTMKFGRIAAVDDVSFEVAAGESVALWGSNGAGKTTLVRCLLGILRARGRIEVGGCDARRRGKALRSLVGYVPQELAFHDDTRLGSAMGFFAGIRRVPASRARELLAQVELDGHERKRVRDLSGGMKQRLALAVALLSDPPLIVLDEPTSNLDAAGRDAVMQSLVALKQRGKTILFASHRPDEVSSLADRVLVLERGRLVEQTRPSLLWTDKAGVLTLRLFIDSDRETEAVGVLRGAGHLVNLNGHGLCVAVSSDRKAEPIGVLQRSDISVRDFQVLADHQPDWSRS